mmetsp:Transcript_2000/g.4940  ORF Transcript_2000/g.4940 Transcript_2000/m.4940 type:complete len:375 (+) Transcript_2000:56-1180(+)
MPSVAEELAALRKSGIAKNHASKLSTAEGLSTPEQEQAALKAKADKEKSYAKEAIESLKVAGAKELDLEQSFMAKQRDAKRSDAEKKQAAAKTLQDFNTAKLDSPMASPNAKNAKRSATPTMTPSTTPVATKKEAAPAPVTPSKMTTTTTTKTTTTIETTITETTTTTTTAKKDEIEVEDVPDLETTDIPTMPEIPPPTAAPMIAAAPPKQNRAEKKARKIMQRWGMTKVPGISRVTMKITGARGGIYAIAQPDVFQATGVGGKNPTYVVFGEARPVGNDGFRQQFQRQAAAAQTHFANESDAAVPSIETVGGGDAGTVKAAAAPEDSADLDESGLEAKDIELCMSQANCSRAKAVAALRENDGDIVNAIMSLT